jgi:Domain of unknown function (DUF6378)
MTDDIAAILAERQKTHGDYSQHAGCTQALKDILRSYHAYEDLIPEHREALDMICHKIGRIIAGNPHFRDHWDDIAGYAKLVANKL